MDDNVVTLIAGLGGTALGGLIAALAGWWQARRQRAWQLEDFKRARVAARDDEVRARADEKALEAQTELDLLERLLTPRAVLARNVSPEDADDKAEVRHTVRRLARAAALMQQPLRQHVELPVGILPDADQLAGWLRVHPQLIVWHVIRNAREAINLHLRNEDVPEQLAEPVRTYSDAWEALQEDIERQMKEQIERQQAEDE